MGTLFRTILLIYFLFPGTFGGPLKHRIVGGLPVQAGVLPWQVILQKDASDGLLCGGSVIAPNWVLTAAHCTYGLSSIFLIFGTNNINTYNVSMISNKLFIHPQYNQRTLNNDVSVIQLPYSLTYTKYIQPIKLATQENQSFLGASAIVAGYGYTDDEDLEFSQTLISAPVVIINNSVCESVFGSDVVLPSTMCAEGINGGKESICNGDSGGPLITQDSKGAYIQIGINSFVAQDECTEGFPSGYARLTSFLTYLEATTGLNLGTS